jgi:hypothetical protein
MMRWMDSGARQRRLGTQHRHADRSDAGCGQHGVLPGSRLLDRLHAPRSGPSAVLRLPVAVTFAMLMLVTSDNLLQMFFGWEGVGLASYLLIGFWYKKPSANAAAMKAFIVNRVGDFGFRSASSACSCCLARSSFDAIFAANAALRPTLPAGQGAEGGETVLNLSSACISTRPMRSPCLPASLHGRHGQVGAVPAAHLAA